MHLWCSGTNTFCCWSLPWMTECCTSSWFLEKSLTNVLNDTSWLSIICNTVICHIRTILHYIVIYSDAPWVSAWECMTINFVFTHLLHFTCAASLSDKRYTEFLCFATWTPEGLVFHYKPILPVSTSMAYTLVQVTWIILIAMWSLHIVLYNMHAHIGKEVARAIFFTFL